MPRNFITVIISLSLCSALCAQPDTLWTKTYGTEYDEGALDVKPTSDGGFIMVGDAQTGGANGTDIWLIKTDENGEEQWTSYLGGNGDERGIVVCQTSDGGYIIAGTAVSTLTNEDICAVKTDDQGNEEWTYTYGGNDSDFGYCICQTTDGGYILTGVTNYFTGPGAMILIKLDSDGNEEWIGTYGGNYIDESFSVLQTLDGGYIIAGYMGLGGSQGSNTYVVKTDELGNEIWSQSYIVDGASCAHTINYTSDGGYIIAGTVWLNTAFSGDAFLVKIDSLGNEEWSQIIGGNYTDLFWLSQQTQDGGYVAAGYTYSYPAGDLNIYIVKTDELGNESWYLSIGGSDDDFTDSVVQLPDGGFIIGATTYSYGAGEGDAYLIRLEAEETPVTDYGMLTEPGSFELYPPCPNPFNQRVALEFALAAAAPVRLSVYDINGREVARLVDGMKSAGSYEVIFDASELTSGIFFAKLMGGGIDKTEKLILIK